MIKKREIENAIVEYVLSLSESERWDRVLRCERFWCGADMARAIGAHRNGHLYEVLDSMCKKGLMKFSPARYPYLDHFGTIYAPDYDKIRKEVK